METSQGVFLEGLVLLPVLRSLGLFGFVEQSVFLTHSLQCVIEPRHINCLKNYIYYRPSLGDL